jgi:protein-S-isoprenylcysteine O-methyltransferase Ste14
MPARRNIAVTESEVANYGIARPPLIYLVSIGAGVLLHLAWPEPMLPADLPAFAPLTLVVGAVGIFVLSTRRFQEAGTPVPGNKPTTAIVRTGPYRFTRNPIYLAFTLLQLGISLWVNSAWLLVTLLIAASVMNYLVIPREERYLERRFGEEYLKYKAAVRRWI